MRQLGKIHCREINKDDNAPWVLCFHGYGADCNDLFSLGEIINTQKTYNWLFPNGILEVPIGPGWTGRAWWNIDMMEIQKAAERGEHRDFSNVTPPGLDKAYAAASEMIQKMNIPWDQIVLMGFSQGAMLATELYLRAPEKPKGLVIMSGTLLHQDQWKPLAEKRAGAAFFQSHGSQDPVLSFKVAQHLSTLLSQAGMKGSLQGFKGGHEIPQATMMAIGKYLDQQ